MRHGDRRTRHRPRRGPVVVTGATGGVGCMAVAILAKLGYEVTAVTGKADRHDWLRQLGPKKSSVVKRWPTSSGRPLLPAHWAAAVDTVGGAPLATLLRSMQHRGCVTACGLVAGADLNISVYPFILRGVTLAGIDSAKCPRPSGWKCGSGWPAHGTSTGLDQLADEVTLDELPDRVAQILAGQIVGRTLSCRARPQVNSSLCSVWHALARREHLDASRRHATLAFRVLPAVFVKRHRRGGGHVVAVRQTPHGDFHDVVKPRQDVVGQARRSLPTTNAVWRAYW